jgi:SLT domain-containing protein
MFGAHYGNIGTRIDVTSNGSIVPSGQKLPWQQLQRHRSDFLFTASSSSSPMSSLSSSYSRSWHHRQRHLFPPVLDVLRQRRNIGAVDVGGMRTDARTWNYSYSTSSLLLSNSNDDNRVKPENVVPNYWKSPIRRTTNKIMRTLGTTKRSTIAPTTITTQCRSFSSSSSGTVLASSSSTAVAAAVNPDPAGMEMLAINVRQLIADGKLHEADAILAEHGVNNIQNNNNHLEDATSSIPIVVQLRMELLNGWLSHQKTLLDQYYNELLLVPTHIDDIHNTHSSSNVNSSDSSMVASTTTAGEQRKLLQQQQKSLSSEQCRLLLQIRAAVESAHNHLEYIEPQLGARRNVWFDGQQEDDDAIDVNNGIDDDAYYYRPGTSSTAPQLPTITTAATPMVVVPAASSNNNVQAEAASPFSSSSGALDRAGMLQYGKRVLAAWAETARAADRGHAPRSYTRGVPQRARFLLERLEAAVPATVTTSLLKSSGSSSTASIGPVTTSANRSKAELATLVDCYLCVIECWTYSREHLRGTAAQKIYDKIPTRTLTKSKQQQQKEGDRKVHAEDGELFRLMIAAWARSDEPRGAFTATGYLMKLLCLLEQEGEDHHHAMDLSKRVDPLLEDYQLVLWAWLRSR